MPESAHLSDALVLLLAAIIVVPILQRLKVAPVLGYLAAGLLIGPFALGLVRDLEAPHVIGEIGVVFLLFAIGLELPLSRLRAMRHFIFGLGLAQVGVTALVIGGAAYLIGLPVAAALIVGGALATSSTATVLRLMSEQGQTMTRYGRVAIAVLLFQDLAVVPLLALLPLVSGEETNVAAALGLALGKGLVAIVAIVLLGRFVIRPGYAFIASVGNAEVFTAANIAVVLAVGWVTAEAGMSMALGAFLGGLLLADTAYRHQIEADIEPFRGLFLGLFFMSIGMSINLPALAANIWQVIGLTSLLLIAKTAVLFALCRGFGLATPKALRVGLLLSQGGEFGFIVFGKAVGLQILSPEVGQILFAVVALSMALTPLLAALGQNLSKRLEDRWGLEQFGAETSDMRKHVIIAGYGRVGRAVARVLAAHDIPFVALDMDPQRVAAAREKGVPVFFGDASHAAVLKAAGADRAVVAIITLNRPDAAAHAVAALRHNHPHLKIVARAHDLGQRRILEEAGAAAVVPETMEASLQLAGHTLRVQGFDLEAIEATLEGFRRDQYAVLEEDRKDHVPKTEPVSH